MKPDNDVMKVTHSNRMDDTNKNFIPKKENGRTSFRCKTAHKTRKEEAAMIREEFPNKIPIICEKYYKEKSLRELDKSKYLVPQEMTMSQFITIIRNRMKLGQNQSLYLLINNKSMLSLSKTLAEIYPEYKAEDGFLYVTYASQEVFGSD